MNKEKKEGGKRGNRKEEGGWRIGFWNIAGLRNKDEKFWKEIGRWEVIVLVETWLDKKGWEKVKIPKVYVWEMQEAKKVSRKGRAMEGMLMGIKRELWEKGESI